MVQTRNMDEKESKTMDSLLSLDRPHFRVLATHQMDQIHNAGLGILQQTGVEVHHPEALRLLREAGARIEGDLRVYIPEFLIQEALASAPSQITVWTRKGQVGFVLGGYEPHFGIMADCPEVFDPDSGERRPMTAEDIGKSARLADALPNLHFVMEAGWAPDYPVDIADRVCFREVLRNTTKPLGFCCTDARTMQDILDMAALAVGGRDALRAKPFIVHYAEPTTPLVHSKEALGKLLLCAQEGIPVVYTPMPISGATAPASFAGTLALAVAECLSGLVIAQLKRRGAAVIFGGIPGPLDMKTTIFPYGSPELQLMVSALTDLAHYYRLPMFGTAGGSDSKTFDEQASMECMMNCLLAAQSGANLIHDVGFLDHCSVTSYDMMVLADEIIGMAYCIIQGIKVDTRELALDSIDEVGPGGSYLDQVETVKRFRSWWQPTVVDRSMAAGEKEPTTLGTRVRTKVRSILKDHQPEPLPDDIRAELDRMESHWS
jgi:trimethylamine--corrinoid protein Co-methyltransferase